MVSTYLEPSDVEKRNPFKIKWPSDEELKVMLSTKTLTAIAHDLGVSRTATRSMCKKRGLIVPMVGVEPTP